MSRVGKGERGLSSQFLGQPLPSTSFRTLSLVSPHRGFYSDRLYDWLCLPLIQTSDLLPFLFYRSRPPLLFYLLPFLFRAWLALIWMSGFWVVPWFFNFVDLGFELLRGSNI